uniref:BED-type domain-containing protein n=1 Tax=Heterorhabditis bacteriophora TaxID=37862 RepID=A0A1I7W644_HETBA
MCMRWDIMIWHFISAFGVVDILHTFNQLTLNIVVDLLYFFMDPRWMSLIPPLPPLFIPPFHSLGVFTTLPSLPFLPTLKTEQKLSIDRSKRFLVEQLLPSEDEKQPPNSAITSKSLQPVLPPRSVEFVNGGYGVKNPLAVCATRDMDYNSLTEEGNFPCRICGKEYGRTNVNNVRSHLLSDAHWNRISEKFTEWPIAMVIKKEGVFVCEECGFTSQLFDVYVSHLKLLHPFSSSLLRLSAPPKKQVQYI